MKSFLKLAAMMAIVASLTTGCASIQRGDPLRSAEIKKFNQKVDTAQIYVCRNGSIFGMGMRPHIEINNNPLATIATSTYAYTELPAGSYRIVAKTPEHESVMEIKLAGGEQKFFQTWVVPGVLAGRGVIDEIKAEEGKECVKNAELVEAVIN
ncbi:DUF2846 domain-containing protein [Quatrionicoccus australiensis]|uniref:DUF2846 domain-containing protein n=1 Tax=Quatrionicoccus australiensis TaxID=138118 RepID=UPI001CF88F89|nr:DUF2846 domain-containing protein [Quatrionicoccus australiensis]UCV15469.1 DUF2846 domain-containing protein [Quatrionicoccus australiensis]